MKTFITAAALALATLSSFAQEATPAPEIDNFVSTRTRAEVRAELQAALASGWRLSQGESSYAPEMDSFKSTRPRAEVIAELRAALASGWRPSHGEASGAPETERFVAQRTRAGVRAEAITARTALSR